MLDSIVPRAPLLGRSQSQSRLLGLSTDSKETMQLRDSYRAAEFTIRAQETELAVLRKRATELERRWEGKKSSRGSLIELPERADTRAWESVSDVLEHKDRQLLECQARIKELELGQRVSSGRPATAAAAFSEESGAPRRNLKRYHNKDKEERSATEAEAETVARREKAARSKIGLLTMELDSERAQSKQLEAAFNKAKADNQRSMSVVESLRLEIDKLTRQAHERATAWEAEGAHLKSTALAAQERAAKAEVAAETRADHWRSEAKRYEAEAHDIRGTAQRQVAAAEEEAAAATAALEKEVEGLRAKVAELEETAATSATLQAQWERQVQTLQAQLHALNILGSKKGQDDTSQEESSESRAGTEELLRDTVKSLAEAQARVAEVEASLAQAEARARAAETRAAKCELETEAQVTQARAEVASVQSVLAQALSDKELHNAKAAESAAQVARLQLDAVAAAAASAVACTASVAQGDARGPGVARLEAQVRELGGQAEQLAADLEASQHRVQEQEQACALAVGEASYALSMLADAHSEIAESNGQVCRLQGQLDRARQAPTGTTPADTRRLQEQVALLQDEVADAALEASRSLKLQEAAQREAESARAEAHKLQAAALQWQADKRLLETELHALQKDFQRLKTVAAELTAKGEAASAASAAAQAERSQRGTEETCVRGELAASKLLVEKLQAELAQRECDAAEATRLTEEKTRALSAARDEALAKIPAAEASVAQATGSLAVVTAQLEGARAKVAQSEAEIRKLQVAAAEAGSARAVAQGREEELRRQLVALETRATTAEADAAGLRVEVSELEIRASEAEDRASALEDKVHKVAEGLATLEEVKNEALAADARAEDAETRLKEVQDEAIRWERRHREADGSACEWQSKARAAEHSAREAERAWQGQREQLRQAEAVARDWERRVLELEVRVQELEQVRAMLEHRADALVGEFDAGDVKRARPPEKAKANRKYASAGVLHRYT
mmetsp:Transcript_8046/g.18671  ORF Transcript_8046/g.18671 Transcript_8046/m.18671 type:complete len:981 (-) Transcript_8046:187-3129(-)